MSAKNKPKDMLIRIMRVAELLATAEAQTLNVSRKSERETVSHTIGAHSKPYSAQKHKT